MDTNILKNKETYITVFKGLLFAICFSLIGILLFAFSLRFFDLSDLGIKVVNQIIKTLSILFGCFVGLRKNRSNGLIKGVIIGVFYTIVSFFLFSILNGEFSFSVNLIFDLLFSVVVGAVCGAIVVNLFRN